MTGAQHDHFPSETPTAWQRLTAQEKYAQVKHALHADHMSYGEAATALGASRVAIAGVVERSKRNPLGPIVSSIRPPTKGVKPKPRKKHVGFNKFVALPFIVPPTPEPPAPDAVWLPLTGSHPVAIELHIDGCRFPIGVRPAVRLLQLPDQERVAILPTPRRCLFPGIADQNRTKGNRMTDWQPIETRPQDGYGGPFLLAWPSERHSNGITPGGYTVAWLEPNYRDGGWSLRTQSGPYTAPTHWAPIAPVSDAANASHAS